MNTMGNTNQYNMNELIINTNTRINDTCYYKTLNKTDRYRYDKMLKLCKDYAYTHNVNEDIINTVRVYRKYITDNRHLYNAFYSMRDVLWYKCILINDVHELLAIK